MVVPAEARERLRAAGIGAAAEGLRLTLDLVASLRGSSAAAGIYLMPQFGRFDVAAEVVEAARA